MCISGAYLMDINHLSEGISLNFIINCKHFLVSDLEAIKSFADYCIHTHYQVQPSASPYKKQSILCVCFR